MHVTLLTLQYLAIKFFIYETYNITFDCFVTRKRMIIATDYKVQIIIKLHKKNKGRIKQTIFLAST